MKFADVYGAGKFGLSFELYPPKTESGMTALFEHLHELVQFRPAYITCTYGAGGSTSVRTLEVCKRVRAEHGLPIGAHLTCVGLTIEGVREYLSEAADIGVNYVTALRGDRPKKDGDSAQVESKFKYANELVSFIREEFPQFGIAVAGYPETHPEAPNRQVDLENLKRKVEAGADVVLTQLFYDNNDFLRFRDRCEAIGIDVPIIPGILPVTNLKQIKRLTSFCGAHLPPRLLERLEVHADNPQGQFDVGVYHATRQVEELMASGGCPGIHLYVLNKSRAAATILRALTLPIHDVHQGQKKD